MRLVLPGMRSRKQGTIVNISSMDGIASLPVNGTYSASKFAIEGITETLWQEIEPLGLRAFLVEPGSFRTGIETRSHFAGSIIDDYEAHFGQIPQDYGGHQTGAVPRRSGERRSRDLPRSAFWQQSTPFNPGQRRIPIDRGETRRASLRVRFDQGSRL